MDFDESRIFYSHQALQQETADGNDDNINNNNNNNDDDTIDLNAIRRHFREFLRNYRQGSRYLYRNALLKMQRRSLSWIKIDLAHVGEYDTALLGFIMGQPSAVLDSMEAAAVDALKTLLYDSNATTTIDDNDDDEEEEANQDQDNVLTTDSIQILFKGNMTPTKLRSIHSTHMNRLIKCRGICISASPVRSRALKIKLRCSRCLDTLEIKNDSGPFGSLLLPQQCRGADAAQCGPNPYGVVADESTFCDRQTLKLQEAPDQVLTGEMPRSVLLACEQSLVDKAPPGTRVSVLVVPTLLHTKQRDSTVKTIYLRVVGLERDTAPGETATFSLQEQEAFLQLSRSKYVYDILCRSMAPSIRGSYTVDIKKALVCMLFGGSRKKLHDGIKLRGDINVLLMGDPSTAKSQFLKFASKVAPVGIYTSGKGSSAAGLTASVVKDARGEFYLEGGAMVLADGGIVAIDEFDKMRPADRVAIHEAMEQQTISIAKAGITTVLNSRSSVLAAANPVFGTYDDLKSASENIDLMTTILSRFDLIFLVRDVREEERDRSICRHVMGVHISSGNSANNNNNNSGGWNNEEENYTENSNNSADAIAENVLRVATTGEGELDVPAMKKYIQYCKTKCAPRLSEEAGDVLASSYVKIRDDVRKRAMANAEKGGDAQAVIPITVRQLEALVRLSESLAKMRLDADVRAEDVTEALRLFRVSTMAANATDNKSSGQMSSHSDMERAESFLRTRLAIGSMVNKQKIVEEAAAQGYNAMVVTRAIAVMAMRGEVQERNQSRLLKRIK